MGYRLTTVDPARTALVVIDLQHDFLAADVTTEDCVHATVRDAMFRDFRTAVLSDACAPYDHPDLGHGAMSAAEVHAATLVVLAQSTSDVLTSAEFTALAKKPD